ncbi:MAG: hypothetical protein J5861_02050 [Desulfovibrio sp.]|nr:hypothetical protein [Desulfovibrio sp.]
MTQNSTTCSHLPEESVVEHVEKPLTQAGDVLTPTEETEKVSDQGLPVEKSGDGVFDMACSMGPLVLLLLLALQSWSSLMGMNLYCPAEAQNVLVFRDSVAQGLWLSPAARCDQWPGFFWLLRGLDWCIAQAFPQLEYELFPFAAILGASLALIGVFVLGRAAGLPRDAALSGGLVLFCTPIFAPVSSFTGPQSLSMALTLFSLACLCHGWQKAHAFLLLPLGFVLAALAGLTGGPVPLVLILLTSVFFIVWRCTLRRGRALDGLLGFVFMLLVVGAWLIGVILWQPAPEYLQHLGNNLFVWPLSDFWWKSLAIAGLGLLPWLFVICCVSWWRVVRFAPWELMASRKENAGMAFLWIALALACALSPFSTTPLGAALYIAGIAAPLLGKALLGLPSFGVRLFHLFTALCLAMVGVLLLVAFFDEARHTFVEWFHIPMTDTLEAILSSLRALPVVGGLCLAASLIPLRMALARKRTSMGKALLIYACVAVFLAQPVGLLLSPQLAKSPEARVQYLEEICATDDHEKRIDQPPLQESEQSAPRSDADGQATQNSSIVPEDGMSSAPETAQPSHEAVETLPEGQSAGKSEPLSLEGIARPQIENNSDHAAESAMEPLFFENDALTRNEK